MSRTLSQAKRTEIARIAPGINLSAVEGLAWAWGRRINGDFEISNDLRARRKELDAIADQAAELGAAIAALSIEDRQALRAAIADLPASYLPHMQAQLSTLHSAAGGAANALSHLSGRNAVSALTSTIIALAEAVEDAGLTADAKTSGPLSRVLCIVSEALGVSPPGRTTIVSALKNWRRDGQS